MLCEINARMRHDHHGARLPAWRQVEQSARLATIRRIELDDGLADCADRYRRNQLDNGSGNRVAPAASEGSSLSRTPSLPHLKRQMHSRARRSVAGLRIGEAREQ